jgi:predicted deacylase
VHGDEVGGIVVIQEIFKRLRKEPLKKGELYAFPLMNPIGFETVSRHIGLSKEDLNRSFPGNPNGSLAERIADKIFSTIIQTGPALILDLHNDWIKSIPYALIDPCPDHSKRDIYNQTIQFARQSGFVVINEQEPGPSDQNLEKTLTGSLVRKGVPAITLELGESYVVNEKNVEDGVRSVWNILAGLGMTEPMARPVSYQIPDLFADRILDYSHQPPASSSGIVRFMVKPGQVIHKGDKVARIFNVFGKPQETIQAERNGLVLGHSDTSVALPGAPVAAFGFL